jgi:DNA-binding NarL/FixJ family response regulator
MPKVRRIKTKYPGVYFVMGKSLARTHKSQRVYYIRYRKKGKEFEEIAGCQYDDKMTPAKAAEIRAEIITGNRLSRKAIREQRNSKENAEKKLKFQELEKQFTDYRLLKEKWFLFTKSATESFSLWDSELNVVELNDATLRLLPDGTKKNEIIGKNLSELSPDSKADGVYEKFVKVIETGEPLFIDDYVPPPRFGEDLHFNLKAFKVGNELGIIMTDITDRNRAERELKKRQVELERKTSDLEEMNTALNVLLEKREKDKFELEENIARNVKELVESYLEKLKGTRLDNRQRIYAEIIEKNLNNIVSPFIRAINADFLALTHTEIQISSLIKHGKSTKEIAELLVLSPRTIDSYREQIRSKLGIKNKKVNLRTYLNSIQ